VSCPQGQFTGYTYRETDEGMGTLLMPSVMVSVRKISFQMQLPNLRSADYFALGAERGIYLMRSALTGGLERDER
jgi:hypothetical protein